MLMARTILMNFPLVPRKNIRNFRKKSGINIFPEFSGKSGIFEISVSLLININIYALVLIIWVGTTLKSLPNRDFGLISQFLVLYFWTAERALTIENWQLKEPWQLTLRFILGALVIRASGYKVCYCFDLELSQIIWPKFIFGAQNYDARACPK